MNKIISTLITFLLLVSAAAAQNAGQLPAKSVWGNLSGSRAPAAPVLISSIFDAPPPMGATGALVLKTDFFPAWFQGNKTGDTVIFSPLSASLNNLILFGTGTGPGGVGTSITARRQNGTDVSPTTTLTNNEIFFLQAYAYDGTNFSQTIPPAIVISATEDWTSTAHGSAIMFQGVPNTTTAGQIEMSIGNGVTIQNTGTAAVQGKGRGTLSAQTALYLNGTLGWSATAPTVASGFCSTGSPITTVDHSNGTAAFDILVGAATCGSTGTLTMPAATTGWSCWANDLTTLTHIIRQTGTEGSTTAVVFTDYILTTGVPQNFAPGDHIHVGCAAY